MARFASLPSEVGLRGDCRSFHAGTGKGEATMARILPTFSLGPVFGRLYLGSWLLGYSAWLNVFTRDALAELRAHAVVTKSVLHSLPRSKSKSVCQSSSVYSK
jgi:hypothetical protein